LKTRNKVLVIAEAANPEWVSVPLVGWSHAMALRSVADVHLVTQVRNRTAIQRAGLVEGKDFWAIDSEAVTRPFWKMGDLLRMGSGKGWTMVSALNAISYPYFEHLVWKEFGPRIRAGHYDIVHRVTPLSPVAVSPIAKKCAAAGVRFVLGPLNGGIPWPPGFDTERRKEREWLSYVRNAYRLLPGREAMLSSCAAILVGSRHTESEIPDRHRDRVVYVPENAVDPARFGDAAPQDVSGTIRACFIGRLVPYKGADMLIEAVAPFVREGRLVLDIVGDGPMRTDLEAMVRRLDVEGGVTFHGNVVHEEVPALVARSNLFIFPSIREFGGGAVLEAMSLGVVPVVVDYGGPGELVTDETGFKVPIGPRSQIVAQLHDRLRAILEDPSGLPSMGTAARLRVQRLFTWSAKAKQVASIYDWVLGCEPRPRFF
jgi:glycosyltransferase involved in cell wall biosynthesis